MPTAPFDCFEFVRPKTISSASPSSLPCLINSATFAGRMKAPEHNPIEHVWQFAKHQISNINKGEFITIKNNFQTTINSRNYNYKI